MSSDEDVIPEAVFCGCNSGEQCAADQNAFCAATGIDLKTLPGEHYTRAKDKDKYYLELRGSNSNVLPSNREDECYVLVRVPAVHSAELRRFYEVGETWERGWRQAWTKLGTTLPCERLDVICRDLECEQDDESEAFLRFAGFVDQLGRTVSGVETYAQQYIGDCDMDYNHVDFVIPVAEDGGFWVVRFSTLLWQSFGSELEKMTWKDGKQEKPAHVANANCETNETSTKRKRRRRRRKRRGPASAHFSVML